MPSLTYSSSNNSLVAYNPSLTQSTKQLNAVANTTIHSCIADRISFSVNLSPKSPSQMHVILAVGIIVQLFHVNLRES